MWERWMGVPISLSHGLLPPVHAGLVLCSANGQAATTMNQERAALWVSGISAFYPREQAEGEPSVTIPGGVCGPCVWAY